MNAHDRIKYFSVVSKVNQGDFSSLNSEEVQWLQDHPDVISNIKNERHRREILRKCPGQQDTVEEILFLLNWIALILTAMVSASVADSFAQLASVWHACCRTHCPIGTIRPVSSAMGINCAGEIIPFIG